MVEGVLGQGDHAFGNTICIGENVARRDSCDSIIVCVKEGVPLLIVHWTAAPIVRLAIDLDHHP